MKWPRLYVILLTGLGVSQLGNWLYLIALNVMLWELTHSPAAIAGLYMIGPVVRIVCNFFVGSYIDRWNKKTIVIVTDLFRAAIVCLMPFMHELWLIYTLVALTNVASTFFHPSSTYLIVTHVQQEHQARFNGLHATLNSGAFMIGPALAGVLLAIYSTSVVIWLNGATFVVCALLLALLPSEPQREERRERVTWHTIVQDWKSTLAYAKQLRTFTFFVVIYSIALMLAFALDSQEMTFLFANLHISESLYGVTVTIAGVGAIVGGFAATALAKTWTAATYVRYGLFLSMGSYLGFYLSSSYAVAVVCFILLGFFMAFSNSGFATLYQKTITPTRIGRVSSMLSVFQSIVQVTLTALLGAWAELWQLQAVAVGFASLAVLLALLLVLRQWTVYEPAHKNEART